MITRLKQDQRQAIIKLLTSTEMFNQKELDIAMEVTDVYLSNPDQKDYNYYVYEENGTVLGMMCYGACPVSWDVYDLYWMAVHKEAQGKGIGSKMLTFAEEMVRKEKARMMCAETSSQPKYEPTRQFYMKRGYKLEAQVKGFYKPDDDKMIFVKRF
jgi:GNAT superfamily N-acetyltransferase